MTLTFFQGRGSRFKNEKLHFLLVNTITQQILIALGPNLYHGCISGVFWLSSKMDDLDFFQVCGSRFKNENLHFLLVNTITQQILVALGPNLYHGCISGVSWLYLKMGDLDLFFKVMKVNLNMKISIFCL